VVHSCGDTCEVRQMSETRIGHASELGASAFLRRCVVTHVRKLVASFAAVKKIVLLL